MHLHHSRCVSASHGVWSAERPRRHSLFLEVRALADAPELSGVAAQCATALASSGIVSALALLNRRTRFRFTGVYQAEPPVLRSVALFDRQNPALLFAGGVTPQGGMDSCAGGSANTGAGLSCIAAPIRLPSGFMWGTLCHFDLRVRLLPNEEVASLRAAAAVFGWWLADSPGPDTLHSGNGHS